MTPQEKSARRDLFAAAALTGLLANPNYVTESDMSDYGLSAYTMGKIANAAATDAQVVADATIEQLNESEPRENETN